MPRRSLTAKQRELCKFFANARAGVRKVALGPDNNFAIRYRATLGGEGVLPPDMPENGYVLRGAALTGARKFKELCRDELAKK